MHITNTNHSNDFGRNLYEINDERLQILVKVNHVACSPYAKCTVSLCITISPQTANIMIIADHDALKAFSASSVLASSDIR